MGPEEQVLRSEKKTKHRKGTKDKYTGTHEIIHEVVSIDGSRKTTLSDPGEQGKEASDESAILCS
jgi:hypothetical protein